MPLFSFEGKSPQVHPEAWIAPTATLVGDVTVEARASVWYGTVVRADFGPILIEEGANIQDNCTLHTGEKVTVIGRGATIGHSCVVHNCQIGPTALIGNGAIVLDGATVGEGALIAAGSVVPPNGEVPAGVIALGSPAKKFVPMTETAAVWVDGNPSIYQELAQRHKFGIKEV